MKHLLLRYQRELTVFAAVLIATGGFAIAALVSEGSQAVGAGTYVVRSDTSGLLVTGEVLDVTTNARGRTVTVVKWNTRRGKTLTRTLRAEPVGPARVTVTESGLASPPLSGLASPPLTVTESETLTMRQVETVSETQTVVDSQTVTETVVVTETLPATTATVEAPPSSE